MYAYKYIKHVNVLHVSWTVFVWHFTKICLAGQRYKLNMLNAIETIPISVTYAHIFIINKGAKTTYVITL